MYIVVRAVVATDNRLSTVAPCRSRQSRLSRQNVYSKPQKLTRPQDIYTVTTIDSITRLVTNACINTSINKLVTNANNSVHSKRI